MDYFKSFFLVCLALSQFFLSGCAGISSNVRSITDEGADLQSEARLELFEQADRAHEKFVAKGVLDPRVSISGYIEELGQSLLPASLKSSELVQFFVLRAPEVNAFAMPNGHIYINAGLITAAKSEAELAFVVAHEIVHVVERHSEKRYIVRQNNVTAANIAHLTIIGSLAVPVMIGDIFSFSKDQELESDSGALQYLINGGQDITKADDFLDTMARIELKGAKGYRTHPVTKKRKENFSLLLKEQTEYQASTISNADFIAVKKVLLPDIVKYHLRKKQYMLAQNAIDTANLQTHYDKNDLTLLQAELFRLKARNPKVAAIEESHYSKAKYSDALQQKHSNNRENLVEQARSLYQELLTSEPSHAAANKGMGLLLYHANNTAEAKPYLENYVSSEQAGSDKNYIKSLMNKTNK